MLKRINAFFNPERFRGWGKKRNYFEGWYFKLVSADEQTAIAVIPGIAMDPEGNRHAFIQLLNGKERTSRYYKFDIHDFIPSANKFEIRIKNNLFSENGIRLDLPEASGELHFTETFGWPKPFYSPGIMGPYSFAPFMECYHGIVSMNHSIWGQLVVEGQQRDFNGGKGYTEKDWGRSFPSAYFWMQSNHFSQPASFKCSVARIPWVRNSFTGFIAGLLINDKLISFTTYNGTRLIKSFADEKKVEIILENKRYRLEVMAWRDMATELASPIHGFMNGRIEESMTSLIDVLLTDKKDNAPVFMDQGRNAGLEVAGKIDQIFLR
jgi:hypothetical protein